MGAFEHHLNVQYGCLLLCGCTFLQHFVLFTSWQLVLESALSSQYQMLSSLM